jgi:hypothetical protein
MKKAFYIGLTIKIGLPLTRLTIQTKAHCQSSLFTAKEKLKKG